MPVKHLPNLVPAVLQLLFLCFTLSACTDLSYQARQAHADQLANHAQWQKQLITTEHFELASYVPNTIESDTLVVYIEGDGMAWINRYRPALNPSPLNPVALELALRHPDNNAVYLARPCQYVDNPANRGCRQAFWADQRFAPHVIAATNEAISQLKARYHSKQLILIGYSGGGAIAALVAAQRDDAIELITVAGNLDHRYWTGEANLSPLTGSLNPADQWLYLAHIPQRHFVGEHDTQVKPAVAKSYRNYFPEDSPIRIIEIDGYDHVCCWIDRWPELIKNSISEQAKNATM